MKQKLLELLQSTEGFLSGQELSDHLNVSRTAVWKVMKSLEEDGYEIEACLLYTSPIPRDSTSTRMPSSA